MSLAIFDLDNTLIAGDSDHLWGVFLCEKGIVDPIEYSKKNDQFYFDYENGTLDIVAYQNFVLQTLINIPISKLNELRSEFILKKITPIILEKGRELVADHIHRGNHPIIVTATNDFITRPIATLLGIDDLLACTAEHVDGKYTGKTIDIPTFREGKVIRLKQWIKEYKKNLGGAWFYTDSHNDLPLLEIVENPIAVDPDQILTNIANNRGWEIISLRS